MTEIKLQKEEKVPVCAYTRRMDAIEALNKLRDAGFRDVEVQAYPDASAWKIVTYPPEAMEIIGYRKGWMNGQRELLKRITQLGISPLGI